MRGPGYDRLWSTVSLRAVVDARLRVDILDLAHHCGMASGIVPSTFRIIRQLLSRLEDELTGDLRPAFLHVTIPELRQRQLAEAAAVLGGDVCAPFAFVAGAGPISKDPVELLINNTWRPTMAVLAQDGLPTLPKGAPDAHPHRPRAFASRLGDVPAVSRAWRRCSRLIRRTDRVSLGWGSYRMGHLANPPWLERAVDRRPQPTSNHQYIGCGVAILVNMLLSGTRVQRFFAGLQTNANAHGPNEFHIPRRRG
jgi:hypothetical protein